MKLREWTLHEEIGRGGLGVVYRATHDILPGDYAIKVTKPELASDPESRQRFLQEAVLISRLKHHNIVSTETPFEEQGRLYLPMQRLQGHTLSEVIASRPGPWPESEAVRVVTQAAEGLGFAHRQTPPVLHRDVKPANLHLGADGLVRVLDFGLAKVLGDRPPTSEELGVGTPAYMAPEVLNGQPATPAADVYALGVVLFRLLTGRLPIDLPAESGSIMALVMAVGQAHMAGLPRVENLVSGVSARVSDVVARCLASAPEARPADGRALVEALRGAHPLMGAAAPPGAPVPPGGPIPAADPGHCGPPPALAAGPGHFGPPPASAADPGHSGPPPALAAGPGHFGPPPASMRMPMPPGGPAGGYPGAPSGYGPLMPYGAPPAPARRRLVWPVVFGMFGAVVALAVGVVLFQVNRPCPLPGQTRSLQNLTECCYPGQEIVDGRCQGPPARCPSDFMVKGEYCSPRPAPTAKDATLRAAQAIRKHRPVDLWDGLPESYQNDLTRLVHAFARRFDDNIYSEGVELLTRTHRVWRDKRDFYQNSAVWQEYTFQRQEALIRTIRKHDEHIAAMVEEALASDLADIDRFREIDIRAALLAAGPRWSLNVRRILDEPDMSPPDFWPMIDNLEIESEGRGWVRVKGSSSRFRWIEVEGHWLPGDLAENWRGTMRNAHASLPNMFLELERNKSKVLLVMNTYRGFLTRLERAQTQAEFDAALNYGLELVVGPRKEYRVVVQVESPGRRDGVLVKLGDMTLGRTDSRGRLEYFMQARRGDSYYANIDAPAGYRTKFFESTTRGRFRDAQTINIKIVLTR